MDAAKQAVTLYAGKVMHQRMKPFGHRFQYSVFSVLIDIDQLCVANRVSRLFSVNRFNFAAFYESDHIDPRVSPLENGMRAYVNRLFENAGAPAPDRVLLFAYPRIFGHAFNPISVYYGFNVHGEICGMIYEVRNTFGERHTYVCPVQNGELTAAGLRQDQDKHFHVSPFIEMGARYHFRLIPPGKSLQFRILETDKDGPLLSATFSGDAKALTTSTLGWQMIVVPLLGLKIVAGIHFEAFKLWWKGARFLRSPPPPDPATYNVRNMSVPGE